MPNIKVLFKYEGALETAIIDMSIGEASIELDGNLFVFRLLTQTDYYAKAFIEGEDFVSNTYYGEYETDDDIPTNNIYITENNGKYSKLPFVINVNEGYKVKLSGEETYLTGDPIEQNIDAIENAEKIYGVYDGSDNLVENLILKYQENLNWTFCNIYDVYVTGYSIEPYVIMDDQSGEYPLVLGYGYDIVLPQSEYDVLDEETTITVHYKEDGSDKTIDITKFPEEEGNRISYEDLFYEFRLCGEDERKMMIGIDSLSGFNITNITEENEVLTYDITVNIDSFDDLYIRLRKNDDRFEFNVLPNSLEEDLYLYEVSEDNEITPLSIDLLDGEKVAQKYNFIINIIEPEANSIKDIVAIHPYDNNNQLINDEISFDVYKEKREDRICFILVVDDEDYQLINQKVQLELKQADDSIDDGNGNKYTIDYEFGNPNIEWNDSLYEIQLMSFSDYNKKHNICLGEGCWSDFSVEEENIFEYELMCNDYLDSIQYSFGLNDFENYKLKEVKGNNERTIIFNDGNTKDFNINSGDTHVYRIYDNDNSLIEEVRVHYLNPLNNCEVEVISVVGVDNNKYEVDIEYYQDNNRFAFDIVAPFANYQKSDSITVNYKLNGVEQEPLTINKHEMINFDTDDYAYSLQFVSNAEKYKIFELNSNSYTPADCELVKYIASTNYYEYYIDSQSSLLSYDLTIQSWDNIIKENDEQVSNEDYLYEFTIDENNERVFEIYSQFDEIEELVATVKVKTAISKWNDAEIIPVGIKEYEDAEIVKGDLGYNYGTGKLERYIYKVILPVEAWNNKAYQDGITIQYKHGEDGEVEERLIKNTTVSIRAAGDRYKYQFDLIGQYCDEMILNLYTDSNDSLEYFGYEVSNIGVDDGVISYDFDLKFTRRTAPGDGYGIIVDTHNSGHIVKINDETISENEVAFYLNENNKRNTSTEDNPVIINVYSNDEEPQLVQQYRVFYKYEFNGQNTGDKNVFDDGEFTEVWKNEIVSEDNGVYSFANFTYYANHDDYDAPAIEVTTKEGLLDAVSKLTDFDGGRIIVKSNIELTDPLVIEHITNASMSGSSAEHYSNDSNKDNLLIDLCDNAVLTINHPIEITDNSRVTIKGQNSDKCGKIIKGNSFSGDTLIHANGIVQLDNIIIDSNNYINNEIDNTDNDCVAVSYDRCSRISIWENATITGPIAIADYPEENTVDNSFGSITITKSTIIGTKDYAIRDSRYYANRDLYIYGANISAPNGTGILKRSDGQLDFSSTITSKNSAITISNGSIHTRDYSDKDNSIIRCVLEATDGPTILVDSNYSHSDNVSFDIFGGLFKSNTSIILENINDSSKIEELSVGRGIFISSGDNSTVIFDTDAPDSTYKFKSATSYVQSGTIILNSYDWDYELYRENPSISFSHSVTIPGMTTYEFVSEQFDFEGQNKYRCKVVDSDGLGYTIIDPLEKKDATSIAELQSALNAGYKLINIKNDLINESDSKYEVTISKDVEIQLEGHNITNYCFNIIGVDNPIEVTIVGASAMNDEEGNIDYTKYPTISVKDNVPFIISKAHVMFDRVNIKTDISDDARNINKCYAIYASCESKVNLFRSALKTIGTNIDGIYIPVKQIEKTSVGLSYSKMDITGTAINVNGNDTVVLTTGPDENYAFFSVDMNYSTIDADINAITSNIVTNIHAEDDFIIKAATAINVSNDAQLHLGIKNGKIIANGIADENGTGSAVLYKPTDSSTLLSIEANNVEFKSNNYCINTQSTNSSIRLDNCFLTTGKDTVINVDKISGGSLVYSARMNKPLSANNSYIPTNYALKRIANNESEYPYAVVRQLGSKVINDYTVNTYTSFETIVENNSEQTFSVDNEALRNSIKDNYSDYANGNVVDVVMVVKNDISSEGIEAFNNDLKESEDEIRNVDMFIYSSSTDEEIHNTDAFQRITTSIPEEYNLNLLVVKHYKANEQKVVVLNRVDEEEGLIANYECYYVTENDGKYLTIVTDNFSDFSILKSGEEQKMNPAIPTDITASLGDKLSDIELPDGWTWDDPSVVVDSFESTTFAATYNTSEESRYKTGVQANLVLTIEKITPIVNIVPNEDIVYDGNSKLLINTDDTSTTGGTIKYSLDEENWSTNSPEATSAGTYVVYYKVEGNDTYADMDVDFVEVEISKASATILPHELFEDIFYTGEYEQLICEIESNYGQVMYALTDSMNAPQDYEYGDAIPSAKDVGTYYVHYKVFLDQEYEDNYSSSDCYTVINIYDNDYHITYNLDEDVINNENNITGYDSGDVFTFKAPTRNGYTFKYWYTLSAKGAEQIITKITSTSRQDYTLYAKWSKNTYTITYNLNGGKNTAYNDSHKKYYVDTKDFDIDDPIRNGYTFLGWFKDKAFTVPFTKTYIEEGDVENIVIYAKWSSPITYSITYHYNGGTELPKNLSEYNVTKAITLYSPVKQGYKFIGWYNENNQKLTSIKKGSYGDVELYARYEPITYTVSYNANGGKGKMANIKATYDEDFDLVDNVYTRQGYTFEGWSTNKKATKDTIEYIDGATNLINLSNKQSSTITLYAIWEPIKYKIRYNSIDPTIESVLSSDIPYDTSYKLIDTALDNPGKKAVKYYYYDTNGVKKVLASTSSIKNLVSSYDNEGNKRVIDFYVYSVNDIEQWANATYTITYNLDKGTNAKANPKTYNVDTNDITLLDASKKGYTFDGWFDSLEDGNQITTINPGIEVNEDHKNITLYARYTPIEYTISLKANGGNTTYIDDEVHYYIYDSKFTIDEPTRTGYTFNGWYLDSAFKKKVTTITPTSATNMTLYAKWIEGVNYTISYNGNTNTSGKVSNTKVTAGKDITLATSAFKKIGKVFKWWNTSQDGQGTSYLTKQTILKSSPLTLIPNTTVTLYAIWDDPHDFTIYFNSDNVESSNRISQTMSNSSYKALKANTYTKPGYTFMGWDIDSSADTVVFKNKATYQGYDHNEDSSVNLYAVWQENTYTIKFNKNGGTGSLPTSVKLSYTQNYTLPSSSLTRGTKSFIGWSTNYKDTTPMYTNEEISKLSTKNGSTVTLYAIYG